MPVAAPATIAKDLAVPLGTGASAAEWSPWQSLAIAPALTPAVLAETLDGGQAFRWQREPGDTGAWLGVWGDCAARLRVRPGDTSDGLLEWSAPLALHARVASALPHYLALDRDFAAYVDSLPWRSDAHLAQCLAEFRGLRLLRQPFGETLLGFMCSATKQIVQIKQMLALVATRHGAPLISHSTLSPQLSTSSLHRLPTWAELATIPETDLRACKLGFRARHVAHTARFLAAHPGWLEETETLPYPAAKERLCSLPGVGEKVADCVLLFGAGKFEAFPVDVWILKTLAHRYALTGWRPGPLAQFGRAHFGPLAGLAQQFLFAWERRIGRKKI